MPKVEGECIRGVRAGGYPQGAGTSPAPPLRSYGFAAA